MVQLRRLLTLSPLRIASGYLVFGVLWILLSDRVVLLITESPTQLARLQTLKGWAFVLGSAALIFGLTQTRELQVASSRNRLDRATQELQVLHRVFRHNIRNDLNVVRGYLDMALDTIHDDEVKGWLRTAATSTGRILDTSEKLRVIEQSDLSTSSSGSVDLIDLIHQEVDWLKSTYPDITVETDLPEQAYIQGDRSVGYVIRELLENATEHHLSPEDQWEITITVEKSMSDVTLQVADNGPGIPDDELAALESGAETDLVHASGVGLWLVKWLCSFYEGEVTIETGSGDGTVVTIMCQLAPPLDRLADRAWDGGRAGAAV